ncbi:MAG TPA: hypothetical protein VJR88_14300, partial [Novosphingobium sp.]|nr:hypothetical protein [Novosphingobium sp.]
QASGMYLALVDPGTYLDFVNPVPFNGPLGVVEQGVLNADGKNSGRAQSAVRPLSNQDFNRIIDLGLADDEDFLPRICWSWRSYQTLEQGLRSSWH